MPEIKVSEVRCLFCHGLGTPDLTMLLGDAGSICADCVNACHKALHPAGEVVVERIERQIALRLAAHFAPRVPEDMLALARTYPLRQQADLQRALDESLGERRVPTNFVGIHQPYRHELLGFGKLLEQGRSGLDSAPAQFEAVDIGGVKPSSA